MIRKSLVPAVLALALCGCASVDPAPAPRSVALLLHEDAVLGDAGRTILRRLTGDHRSPGELFAAHVSSELSLRGVSVVTAPAGMDRAAAAAWAAAEGGAEGVLEIDMGRWDLESVGNGVASVEHGISLLRAADGSVLWSHRRGPVALALRPGEQRDLSAFVQRMAIEGMRGFP